MTFADAYLSGLFSSYYCRCGHYFGLDGLEDALRHWNAGHYKERG